MRKRFIEKKTYRKVGMISLVIGLMILANVFGSVPRVYADSLELDIADGDITITTRGYKVGNGEEITCTRDYTIVSSKGPETPVENSILVESGEHEIILSGVNIASESPFSIRPGASVNLTLVGENTLESDGDNAALSVPFCATLTITEHSTGSLNANSYGGGAGIGGDNKVLSGSITINGGTITARGGHGGAGIGGGSVEFFNKNPRGKSGVVTINGGTVTAIGGDEAAGIGSGILERDFEVIINGGTVTASGGYEGAGIGAGSLSASIKITINGGTVIANGGEEAAGIGNGFRCVYGEITITGGTITAIGGDQGAGIGKGLRGGGIIITISGGIVTANGGRNGSGIGHGEGFTYCPFSTTDTGNAFIVATSISDHTNKKLGEWRGIIFEGNEGNVYGDITLNQGIEIPAGKTLTIGKGNRLIVGTGVTLKISGKLNNLGTLGIQDEDGTMDDNYDNRFSGDGELTGDGEYVITDIDIMEDFIVILSELFYDGEDLRKQVILNSPTVCVRKRLFKAEFTNWEIIYLKDGKVVTEVKEAGEYIVIFKTKDGISPEKIIKKTFSVIGIDLDDIVERDVSGLYDEEAEDKESPDNPIKDDPRDSSSNDTGEKSSSNTIDPDNDADNNNNNADNNNPENSDSNSNSDNNNVKSYTLDNKSISESNDKYETIESKDDSEDTKILGVVYGEDPPVNEINYYRENKNMDRIPTNDVLDYRFILFLFMVTFVAGVSIAGITRRCYCGNRKI